MQLHSIRDEDVLGTPKGIRASRNEQIMNLKVF